MIAIAGSKGGCGKSVTTLGLADAFAREDHPAIAVDADRQMPTLHVYGDVDREPTLANLTRDGTDVQAAVHQSPREQKAGILTAPSPADQVDLQATLTQLEQHQMQLLVDCPSGAGPDAVEAMRTAGRVIVVTTGTKQSIKGAQTTIDMANRLHVPVEGLILNRCEGVPEDVTEEFDVPILSVVPERESPLEHPDSRDAYRKAVAQLSDDVTDPTTQIDTDTRLPTGVAPLDRELNGGVPPGTVVTMHADPNSQSELLLYELTAERGTLYLTTERRPQILREDLKTSMADAGSPTIRYLEGERLLAEATELVGRLPDGANLIIDTMDTLERTPRQEYLEFLNHLTETIRETGSVALLHCLCGESTPANRPSTEHFSDMVFDIQTETGLDELTQSLVIPKSRSERVPVEPIELDLTEQSIAQLPDKQV